MTHDSRSYTVTLRVVSHEVGPFPTISGYVERGTLVRLVSDRYPDEIHILLAPGEAIPPLGDRFRAVLTLVEEGARLESIG